MTNLETWTQVYMRQAGIGSTIDRPNQTLMFMMDYEKISNEVCTCIYVSHMYKYLYMLHWGRHLYSTEPFRPKNLSQKRKEDLNLIDF